MGEKEEGERVSTVKPTTSEKEEIELPGEQGGERGGTVEPAESRKRKRTDETTQGGGEGSEPGSKAARVDTQSSGTAAVQAQSETLSHCTRPCSDRISVSMSNTCVYLEIHTIVILISRLHQGSP